VWTIGGRSPDWWRFRPDRARTAQLLGILATSHDERAAIERAAGIARRVLAGGTE
jgi:hypothetical protein